MKPIPVAGALEGVKSSAGAGFPKIRRSLPQSWALREGACGQFHSAASINGAQTVDRLWIICGQPRKGRWCICALCPLTD